MKNDLIITVAARALPPNARLSPVFCDSLALIKPTLWPICLDIY